MTQRYLGTISEARQDVAHTLGDLFAAPEKMERVMGIEPTSGAWEAPILPLNYTRADEMPELSEETVSQLHPNYEIWCPENDDEPIEFPPKILSNEIDRRQQRRLSFCH